MDDRWKYDHLFPVTGRWYAPGADIQHLMDTPPAVLREAWHQWTRQPVAALLRLIVYRELMHQVDRLVQGAQDDTATRAVIATLTNVLQLLHTRNIERAYRQLNRLVTDIQTHNDNPSGTGDTGTRSATAPE